MTTSTSPIQFDVAGYIQAVGKDARAASIEMAKASTEAKNAALSAIADAVLDGQHEIMLANAEDLKAAQHLESALVDRLELTEARIRSMAEGAAPSRRFA